MVRQCWTHKEPVCVFAGRYWEMVERLKINQFYGAPTAIRLLLNYGEEWVKKYDRSSLKTLGSGRGGMLHLKKTGGYSW